jgi:peptidoglycan/xylan/chitin deacetylase (PgdA/CDA1 family)
MFNRITIKRILREMTGWSEIYLNRFIKNDMTQQACVFYYHRIADVDFNDSKFDDRNVCPLLFEKQIAILSEFAEVVPILELQKRVQIGGKREKPLVSITFDDGFANFHSNVLPIIKRYNVPVTLSVVTDYLGSTYPLPFDRWGKKNFDKVPSKFWRILNWGELEDCVSSGLVTLGSHSNMHLKASECSDNQIEDEVAISADILKQRFGKDQVNVYAYPYGNTY